MIALKTRRLVLRRVEVEDAETIYEFLGCDAEMTKYTGWNPYTSLAATIRKIEQDNQNSDSEPPYGWVIQAKTEMVGTIGAYDYEPQTNSIEIGYSIFRNAWGQGYATEALSEVIRYLFEEKSIDKICAWCHRGNIASQKVLEKAGLIKEGVKQSTEGLAMEQVIYGIARDEWKRIQVMR